MLDIEPQKNDRFIEEGKWPSWIIWMIGRTLPSFSEREAMLALSNANKVPVYYLETNRPETDRSIDCNLYNVLPILLLLKSYRDM